ncbi:MAG: hypothetical protein ACR2JW_03410 [Thermomicrobiales bacterium]
MDAIILAFSPHHRAITDETKVSAAIALIGREDNSKYAQFVFDVAYLTIAERRALTAPLVFSVLPSKIDVDRFMESVLFMADVFRR